MEQRKPNQPRPRGIVTQIRPKANQPLGGLIPLGNRPNAPDQSSSIASSSSTSNHPSSSTAAASSSFKRIGPTITPTSLPLSKKPRLGVDEVRQQSSSPSSIGVHHHVGKRPESIVETYWQLAPNDVTPATFAQRFRAAEEKEKPEKGEKLILGLTRYLFEHRMKVPDATLTVQFCELARDKANYFKDLIIEALCAVIRKPIGMKVIARCHPLTYQLVCNVIYKALQFRDEWPEILVKTYLEDSLGERLWVDRKECHHLVQNVLTAFGTEQPSPEFYAYLYFGEGRTSLDRGGGASPVHAGSSPLYDEDSRSRDASEASNVIAKLEEEEKAAESGLLGASTPVVSPARFRKSYDSIRHYTIQLLGDWWSRRLDTVPKGLVKTMADCCGYHEVRLAAAQKLDAWLQNPKIQRVATELMMAVCINFKEHLDVEMLSWVTRLRLKSRVVTNNFCFILKELFVRVPSSLPIILKMVVHNELAPTGRAPNNMLIIGQCFQFSADASSQTLASIFFDMLSAKEDLLRAVRGLLREVVKTALKHDFPMNSFSRALMQERPIIASFEPGLKKRIFLALEDLICVSAFLGIGPSLRDTALAVGRGDRRDVVALTTYQRNVRQLQNDALAWLHQVVPALFRPMKDDYLRCLYRVTFLEKPAEFYSSRDGWPSDQERNLFLKIISESGLEEDMLLRVLTIGLSSDNTLSTSAALEHAEQLVRRAAMALVDPKFSVPDSNALKINRTDVIDLIFNCSRYRPPENYQLPQKYVLPMLAIAKSFWQSANILLILAAYNPSLIGRIVWENYPTLQFMMEMVISEDYSFPPATAITGNVNADEIIFQNQQMAEVEKQEILQLEGYLATTVVITEANSNLLAHLMRLEPKGIPRRPPPNILETLKYLNQQINLGLTLCSSREPDFLLEIINRQGSSHSLPWLIQFIQKNEGSLRLLPVECLCEFLLHHLENERGKTDEPTEGKSISNLLQNGQELKQRLIDVVWGLSADVRQVESTLLYFFNRLQADSTQDRKLAIHALEVLLKPKEDIKIEPMDDGEGRSQFDWLVHGLPAIPKFEKVRGSVVGILSKCAMVETNLLNLRTYISFLHQHAIDEELDDVALNLGRMIYGRRSLVNLLLRSDQDSTKTLENLLDIFSRHLTQVQASSGVISWSANQDQLLVQWSESASASMNVNVVAAMLLLLGYPKPEGASDSYQKLMDNWFPSDDVPKPTAYMLDTSEEAELIPEDVKFQLICSENEYLVDSVLKLMDDRQILTCIEYSGLPSKTVSKVCELLDTVVISNTTMLNEMDARSQTWLSCLQAHGSRGANIGTKFIDWCKESAEKTKANQIEKMDTSMVLLKVVEENVQPTIPDPLDETKIDQILTTVFGNDGKIDDRQFYQQWSALLIEIASKPSVQSIAIGWLIKETSTTNKTTLANRLNRNQEMVVSLLRILGQRTMGKARDEFIGVCGRLIQTKELGKWISHTVRTYLDDAKTDEEKMDIKMTVDQKPTTIYSETELSNEILSILEKLRSGALECEEAEVDRVLKLDPEIARVAPWKQLEYLFGTNNSVGLRHLLSLLPHYGRVDTLRNVVEMLLSWPGNTYDYKKVLDFIAAIIELPRLWTGREPKLPRHYRREDILNLSQKQLEHLLHYIVNELAAIPSKVQRCADVPTTSTMTTTGKSRMEWRPHEPFASNIGLDPSTSMEGRLQERLKLLLECGRSKMQTVVRWLLAAPANGYDKNVTSLLILELYFAQPDILKFIPDLTILRDVRCLVHSGSTQLDATLFRLLNAASRFAETRGESHDLEQVHKKLMEIALVHPTMVVRHTPLIAAYLRGTTVGFSINRYSRTSYLEWHEILLDLLDKLRPAIFDVHYVDTMLDIVKSFFNFIQAHGLRTMKTMRMVEKVVKLIVAFHDQQQTAVSQFLETYTGLLQALVAFYVESPIVSELKKICC